MQVPEEYITGNAKLDEKIRAALERDEKNNASRNVQKKLAVVAQEVFGDKKRNGKYNVADKEKRTYKNGELFASTKEMERYDYLLHMQRGGLIKDLRSQVEFVLQDSFQHEQWGYIQKLIYVADFVYINISLRKGLEGKEIVEDSKGGVLTSVYKIKRKLLLKRYPNILFFEV